ncbi:50S ribosomal protein L23 [Enterobacteriaceae endosymbiont of Macroplea mutica]|uniref:50S ribosomal protein L23 n=1 Tax=Enterobacteriaceae endosymbiont of Macroplea mutica TaxID=2675791 RepID=UPI0014497C72|nr:50S ribosomal protein L23 [Enterobacteriaceae endosymbiont of Macroplea mutica]QJC31297.1 50S ribosomal protein L23 [Enterobacteriaceae endosymbiont of Macroplea mutica]
MMIHNYFTILQAPHISEKTSLNTKKNNIVIIKILKKASKKDIQISIEKIFNVKVKNINTLIIKGKFKKNKKNNYFYPTWKKAYITLQKNYNIDFNINIH